MSLAKPLDESKLRTVYNTKGNPDGWMYIDDKDYAEEVIARLLLSGVITHLCHSADDPAERSYSYYILDAVCDAYNNLVVQVDPNGDKQFLDEHIMYYYIMKKGGEEKLWDEHVWQIQPEIYEQLLWYLNNKED